MRLDARFRDAVYAIDSGDAAGAGCKTGFVSRAKASFSTD